VRLGDLPWQIRECLAVREAYRQLGYGPDAIWFCQLRDGYAVKLEHRGLEFFYTVSPPVDYFVGRRVTDGETQSLWAMACYFWNSPDVPEAEKRAIFEQSTVRRNAVELIRRMHAKGFPVDPRPDA
jgi:hypothetical protein